MSLELVLKPIACFESCFKDKFAIPRQPGLVPHAWGRLHFEKFVQPEIALEGLEGYSHLWLIFSFHANSNLRYHAKVHPPRLKGKTMGALATRSPHRPNNIGLSLVKLEKVANGIIEVSGGDLLDGTPIYDIKPYLPGIESVPDALSGWSAEASDNLMSVNFEPNIEKKINEISDKIQFPNLKLLVEEVLQRDPRPQVYKENDYKDLHVIRLFDWDFFFKVIEHEKQVTVTKVAEFQKRDPN